MPEPRVLSLDEIRDIAARLTTAAGSARVPRALRTDIVMASLLIRALLRTGVISGPIQLQGGHHDG